MVALTIWVALKAQYTAQEHLLLGIGFRFQASDICYSGCCQSPHIQPLPPQQTRLSQLLTLAKSRLATNPLINPPHPESVTRAAGPPGRPYLFLLTSFELSTGPTTEPEARYKSHITAWQARFDLGTDSEIAMRDEISGPNGLVYLYNKSGRWAEAPELARRLPGLMRMHPMLGPGPPPQEMGARMMLVECLARQGWVDEARRGVEEGYKAVEGLKGGRFG